VLSDNFNAFRASAAVKNNLRVDIYLNTCILIFTVLHVGFTAFWERGVIFMNMRPGGAAAR